jgi:hypothetical protein
MLLVGWLKQLLEFACSRNGEFTTDPLVGTTTFTSAAFADATKQQNENARASSRATAQDEQRRTSVISPPEAHLPGRLEGNVPPAQVRALGFFPLWDEHATFEVATGAAAVLDFRPHGFSW